MLKFNKVLLASDFDNTLVYTQGALERGEDIPPMSARNREAVEYFMQNGGYFSISTGRALPAFARYAQDLPCNAPCVIANGAAIYDFNKDCMWKRRFSMQTSTITSMHCSPAFRAFALRSITMIAASTCCTPMTLSATTSI